MTRADRKYLAFAITTFVLLGLVGLGVYLYKPLRLRYAIHKARGAPVYQLTRMPPPQAGKWLLACVEGACDGNRPAMRAVIEHGECLYVPPGAARNYSRFYPDTAYLVAERQTDAFFEVLGEYHDFQSSDSGADVPVLIRISNSFDPTEEDYGVPEDVDADFWRDWLRKMRKFSISADPEASRVASAALEYARRHFPKELAEAEAKKKEESAP